MLTADDVPHNKVGHLQQDWDVMIAKGDITRCVGTPSAWWWRRMRPCSGRPRSW
ncbi:MAG: hypothetical protein ACLRIS_17185 [Flavonifractor plautii]